MNTQNTHATQADVLENQHQIKQVAQHITNLEGLIAKQEKTIVDCRAKMPDLAALEQRREDLLADIAIGTASTSEPAQLDKQTTQSKALLEQLDKQIIQPQALAKKLAPEISAAEHTIAGLKRKAQEAEADLLKLQAHGKNLLRSYLLGEAQQAGTQYLEITAAFTATFKRLHALSALLQETGAAPITVRQVGLVNIPSFNLDALVGRTEFNKESLFSMGGGTQITPMGWMAAEKQALAAQGIEIN